MLTSHSHTFSTFIFMFFHIHITCMSFSRENECVCCVCIFMKNVYDEKYVVYMYVCCCCKKSNKLSCFSSTTPIHIPLPLKSSSHEPSSSANTRRLKKYFFPFNSIPCMYACCTFFYTNFIILYIIL